MEQLYHFQNDEGARYGEGVEDRFVWGVDSDTARDNLKKILDDEEIEWNIDDFDCWLVYDEDGNTIERSK